MANRLASTSQHLSRTTTDIGHLLDHFGGFSALWHHHQTGTKTKQASTFAKAAKTTARAASTSDTLLCLTQLAKAGPGLATSASAATRSTGATGPTHHIELAVYPGQPSCSTVSRGGCLVGRPSQLGLHDPASLEHVAEDRLHAFEDDDPCLQTDERRTSLDQPASRFSGRFGGLHQLGARGSHSRQRLHHFIHERQEQIAQVDDQSVKVGTSTLQHRLAGLGLVLVLGLHRPGIGCLITSQVHRLAQQVGVSRQLADCAHHLLAEQLADHSGLLVLVLSTDLAKHLEQRTASIALHVLGQDHGVKAEHGQRLFLGLGGRKGLVEPPCDVLHGRGGGFLTLATGNERGRQCGRLTVGKTGLHGGSALPQHDAGHLGRLGRHLV
ncbi:hypothetical protein D3C73_876540 [compost metagenome]